MTQEGGAGGDKEEAQSGEVFVNPVAPKADFTDGRKLGDWRSKYPVEARKCINNEAYILAGMVVASAIFSAIFLAMADQTVRLPLPVAAEPNGALATFNINFRLPMLFFVGCLGGATFSVKWLVHSAAKCKWHLDRRYWRFFVPLVGGVYAYVVLTLLDGGMIGDNVAGSPRSVPLAAALAFLVGYFSDGVSGLLSNIANAVFGTLEKK